MPRAQLVVLAIAAFSMAEAIAQEDCIKKEWVEGRNSVRFINGCGEPMKIAYCLFEHPDFPVTTGDTAKTCLKEGLRVSLPLKSGENVVVLNDIVEWPSVLIPTSLFPAMAVLQTAFCPANARACELKVDGQLTYRPKVLTQIQSARLESTSPEGARASVPQLQKRTGTTPVASGVAEASKRETRSSTTNAQEYSSYDISWSRKFFAAVARGGPCSSEGGGRLSASAQYNWMSPGDLKAGISFRTHSGYLPATYQADGQEVPWNIASRSALKSAYKDDLASDNYLERSTTTIVSG